MRFMYLAATVPSQLCETLWELRRRSPAWVVLSYRTDKSQNAPDHGRAWVHRRAWPAAKLGMLVTS